MAHAFNVGATNEPQRRYNAHCTFPGCKNPATLAIQLTSSYGPPSIHIVCRVHGLELMPGFLALAELLD